MSPIILFILFYNLTYTCSNSEIIFGKHRLVRQAIPAQAQPKLSNGDELPHEKVAVLNVKLTDSKDEHSDSQIAKNGSGDNGHMIHVQRNETSTKTNATKPNAPPPPQAPKNNNISVTEMESGAFFRGMLVFVGLSVLFIMYVAFKTYYRKKSRPPAMVRKYGVRTRRSDLEMTPLPLDEDEDDETVFDVGNVNR